ncbi:hypothetical protein D9757_002716 [Collybiopsis confluens]|uniref:Uncharacterized protein n=1 Tax=Collybiopsis confluens TaxID=2823264 RepID=A0A8H5MEE2_9AGAR|nr:hypothetical protein D9757_002716 [Collybiopsis confluens]
MFFAHIVNFPSCLSHIHTSTEASGLQCPHFERNSSFFPSIMRRFVSVFSNKREKNEKTAKRTASVALDVRIQPLNSETTTFDSSLSTPHLSSTGSSEPANSSASSAGSVSLSLQTPEDSPLVHSRKSWIPWLAKKSGTTKGANLPESKWTPLPSPLLRNPPPGARTPINTDDPDPDSESDAYGEEEDPHSVRPVTEKLNVTSASLAKAKAVLNVSIQNNLNGRSSAPFVIQPGTPLYPRSCNHSRSLPRSNSLASTILKRHLLHKDVNLRPSEAESSIASSSPDVPISLDMVDDKALSTSERTALFSIGLRHWIARPPFEDRYSVWSAVEGNIVCQRISNSPNFALAALEFSEVIEVASDIYGLRSQYQTPADLQAPVRSVSSSDVPSSASSASSHMSSSASPTKSLPSPPLLAPSPLRNQASTPSLSSLQRESGPVLLKQPSPVSSTTEGVEPRSPVKRGVRFIEEDRDESVPVAYVMRIKKQREEKARFLREQKERRQFEEERAKFDEERRQRDVERRKWEQEKMAWEKEKRAIEEERKRKQYADEVVASRQRAESSRLGTRASSFTSVRDSERISGSQSSRRLSRGSDRPPSPSRRQTSETLARDQSFASMGPSSPRPSSVHSSAEDIRSASAALYLPPVPMITPFIPYQIGYTMDMPLLPPTAPFMVNQYPRRHSQSSDISSRQRISTVFAWDKEDHEIFDLLDPNGDMHPVDSSTAVPPSVYRTWFIALVQSAYASLNEKINGKSDVQLLEDFESDRGYESATTVSEGSGTATPPEGAVMGNRKPATKAGGRRKAVKRRLA